MSQTIENNGRTNLPSGGFVGKIFILHFHKAKFVYIDFPTKHRKPIFKTLSLNQNLYFTICHNFTFTIHLN